MTVTMNEEVGATFQKGLSEWWSEETEYVFQRIERWAAFARGYNRLRSQRLSRGRLTMQEEQESRWSISSNKLIIDDPSWSPRFHTLKRCRGRKSRPEEAKINCCGSFNYQSNSSLDSSCLERYRYDHSIYFKTIGDIRNSKKEMAGEENPENEERASSTGSEERIEWDAESISDFLSNLQEETVPSNAGNLDSTGPSAGLENAKNPTAWPIVDLSKLDLNHDRVTAVPDANQTISIGVDGCHRDEQNNNLTDARPVLGTNGNYCVPPEIPEISARQSDPGNSVLGAEPSASLPALDEHSTIDGPKNQDGIKRFLNFRKTRRLSRPVKQPPVIGENSVVWPGVLLNYTKNIDHSSSPHHHYYQNHQRRLAQK